MRKLLLASLVALLVPTAPLAQVQLGLRVGYAPALGDAYKDKDSGETSKMKDGLKAQIPIQLDANYKLTKDWAAGLYLSYGFGQTGGELKDLCDATGADCSASGFRVGAQALYTFNSVQAALVPWLGFGLGYESVTVKAEGADAAALSGGFVTGKIDFEEKLSGFELNLQAGGDYRVSPKFAIGPYLLLAVGQYTSVKDEMSGAFSGSEKLSIEKKLHQWFGFGIRGAFDL